MAKTTTKKNPEDPQVRKHKALMQSMAMPGQRDASSVPMMSREAAVQNVDADARTFEAVWTSGGARVRRYDWLRERWYWEELSLDPAHIRMGRLQSGRAPVLDTHWGWSVQSVLGVVEKASLTAGKEGLCKMRLSKRDDVADVIGDIRDGIIANVSVGYNVYRIQMVEPKKEGELWVYRVIDWEPLEVSLVPMPADEAAGIRNVEDDERFQRCEFIPPAGHAGSDTEGQMAILVSLARALGISSPDGAEEAKVRSSLTKHLSLKDDASDDDIASAALKRTQLAPQPPAAPAPAADAVAAERARAAEIGEFCTKHRADAEFRDKAIKENWSVDRTGRELLSLRAEKGDTTGPSPIPPSTGAQLQRGGEKSRSAPEIYADRAKAVQAFGRSN